MEIVSASALASRPYSHAMIDIETTGLASDHSAIIQLTAVCFDLEGHQIDPDIFNQCLLVPPTRFWDEGTRNWWLDKPDTLKGIYERMRAPTDVMTEFYNWCGGQFCHMHFWSKPLSFDFPFVQSYCREFSPGAMPFDHRKGMDMRTFLRGYSFPKAPMNEYDVPFEGEAHNALYDTLHQIKILWKSIEHEKIRRSNPAC